MKLPLRRAPEWDDSWISESDTMRHNCATLCLFTYNSKTMQLIYLNWENKIDQMILNNFRVTKILVDPIQFFHNFRFKT